MLIGNMIISIQRGRRKERGKERYVRVFLLYPDYTTKGR
jgi:hypothetical protein